MTISIKAVVGFSVERSDLTPWQYQCFSVIEFDNELPIDLSWLDPYVDRARQEVQKAIDCEFDAEVTVSQVLKHFTIGQFYVEMDVNFPDRRMFDLIKLKEPELLDEIRSDWNRYKSAVLVGIPYSEMKFYHDYHYPIGFI